MSIEISIHDGWVKFLLFYALFDGWLLFKIGYGFRSDRDLISLYYSKEKGFKLSGIITRKVKSWLK